METYFDKPRDELLSVQNLDVSVLIWFNNLLFHGVGNSDGVFISPMSLDNPVACGSGMDHALTAMDMGATAKEAVKWAMKRDTLTGGRIRTFKLG